MNYHHPQRTPGEALALNFLAFALMVGIVILIIVAHSGAKEITHLFSIAWL